MPAEPGTGNSVFRPFRRDGLPVASMCGYH